MRITQVTNRPSEVPKRYRAIIVDDEFDIKHGLATYFPWERYRFTLVNCFDHGKDALEFALKNSTDVLIADIRMPGFSGIDIAKGIYEHGLDTIVVFISAYRDFDYAQAAIKYGVVDYLLKPTSFEDIGRMLESVRMRLDERTVMSENSVQTSDNEPGYYLSLVEMVKTYVLHHLPDVTLQTVADSVYVCPQYLSRIFKEYTGETFSEYLMRARMLESTKLLRQPDLRIYEISELVGYSNPKNFARAFRNFFGTTPFAFRVSGTADTTKRQLFDTTGTKCR